MYCSYPFQGLLGQNLLPEAGGLPKLAQLGELVQVQQGSVSCRGSRRQHDTVEQVYAPGLLSLYILSHEAPGVAMARKSATFPNIRFAR